MDGIIKFAVNLLMAILIGFIAGAMVFLISSLILPCKLFGWSSFEGECGYGFFYLIGVPSGLLSAIAAYVWLSAKSKGNAISLVGAIKQLPKSLAISWAIAFIFGQGAGFQGYSLYSLTVLAVFIALTFKMATHLGKPPIIGLLALIPYTGVYIATLALFWPSTTRVEHAGGTD